MILTQEEYARGFIDFDAAIPEGCRVQLWTRTANQPGDETEWTGPYSNPQGSKVLSSPESFIQLSMALNRGADPTKTPILKKVRWERGGRTFIWPGPLGFNGPPGSMSLGRDYGVSYRLVFQPKKITWSEPFIIIRPQFRIRFCKGGTKGYKITGFHDAQLTSEGTLSVEGAIEEVEAEDDIIEILATVPGNYEEQAKEEVKNQVESIVGMLALCFGEQILGKTIFAEYYFSKGTGEQGDIHVPVKHLVEVSIDNNSTTTADEALSLLSGSSIIGSIPMALRWYAAALASESPVDAYISYFIGLEAIASGYFAGLDPQPIREAYTQLKDYFSQANPAIDGGLKEVALSRISDFPLSQKFKEYWISRFSHETPESTEFPQLNRLRSKLLHGKARYVSSQQVNTVRKLLEQSLAKEFDVYDVVAARQFGPQLLEFIASFITVPPSELPNEHTPT